MLKLTQAHKIGISVAAIFMVSLSIMLFMLSGNSQDLGHMQADVSHSSGGEASVEGDSNSELLNKYKAYFEKPGDIIFATDAESKFTYANPDFCKLIEENCGLINGKLFFDYVNEKDLADFASTHAKIVKTGDNLEGLGPYRLHKANGDQGALVMINIHTLLDNDKKVVEIVFSLKDITKQVNEMKDDLPAKEPVDTKSSEVLPLPKANEPAIKEEGEDSRPGDTRLMVKKISFNMRLLSQLF